MKRIIVILLVVFFILTGTTTTGKQNEAGTQAKPQVLWKWGTDLEPTDVSDIVASDSFFLIPSKSGTLTCVDFQTGSIKWSYAIPDEKLKKPVIENKNIILLSNKTIVCLNESGKEIWKKNYVYLERQFVAGNGFIVFTHRNLDQWHQQSNDLFLTCLDAGSGKMLWEEITDPNQYDYGIVQLVDGLLYVVPSTYTPVIKCLDPSTGKLVFEHRFEEGLSLHTNMAIGQSRIVYVKGTQTHETNLNKFIFVDYDSHIDYYQFKFECLDAKTGNVLWTKPCDFDFNSEYNNWNAPETIKIDKGNFFVNYTGIIYSFSLRDGSAKYSFNRDGHALHMRENYTYAYEDERIITRDYETGKETTASFGSSTQSLVLDSSGFVYLMTVDYENNGQLRCFKKYSDNSLGYIWLRKFTGYLHNAFFDTKQERIAIVTGYDYSKPDKILCFDSEKGEQLWNFPVSGFSMNPLITRNFVFTFLGTNISCLDKKNGKQVWRFNISNPIDKPALSNNESIFLNSDAFTILCLDQATGKQKWSYNSKKGVSAVQFLDSGSLLAKEGMNFLNLNPTTGELIYQFAQLAVSSSTFIDGKTICNYDTGNVMFINTETKTISQSMLLPPVKRILEDFANLDVNVWGYWQRKLLVSVLDYDKNRQVNLICYNAETFKELWSIPIKEPSYKESIQILDGKILLLNENFLSLRSMDNGEILWQRTLNMHNPEHLSVNPDYVYIKDQSEAICFSAETGKTMWEYEDKKVTTRTCTYQDEMVLCSFGAITFLKGNLPVKAVAKTSSSFPWKYLAIALIILMLLTFLVILLRKVIKTKH